MRSHSPRPHSVDGLRFNQRNREGGAEMLRLSLVNPHCFLSTFLKRCPFGRCDIAQCH